MRDLESVKAELLELAKTQVLTTGTRNRDRLADVRNLLSRSYRALGFTTVRTRGFAELRPGLPYCGLQAAGSGATRRRYFGRRQRSARQAFQPDSSSRTAASAEILNHNIISN